MPNVRPTALDFGLEAAGNYEAVRAATQTVCAGLRLAGLRNDEVNEWELAVAEAGNNAVKHAGLAGRDRPVGFSVFVDERSVEVTVADHTPGFALPASITLPPDDSEHGRGLFLMRQLTDTLEYVRGADGNRLTLRRKRSGDPSVAKPVVARRDELVAQLAASEAALSDMMGELSVAWESLDAIFSFRPSSNPDAHTPEGFARHCLEHQLLGVGPHHGAPQIDWYLLRLADEAGLTLRVVPGHGAGEVPETLALGGPPRADDPLEVRAARSRTRQWIDPHHPLLPGDPLGAIFVGGSGFVHPIFVNEQLIGVLTVGRNAASREFSSQEVSFIETVAGFLGPQIQNARLHEARLAARLVARELDIAARIQESLLPPVLPQPAGFGLAGLYRAARQVGGDFYTAFLDGDRGLVLFICDVMGKGVPAALFAVQVHSLVRARSDLASQPARFLEWLNRNLAPELDRVEMFITAQVAYIDPARREMRVASAGHPLPLLAVPGRAVIEVGVPGLPLGFSPDSTYEEVAHPLAAGARLLLYTDGINEARAGTGEFFGTAKTQDWLASLPATLVGEAAIRAHLLATLDQFQRGADQADDQAALILTHLDG